MSEEYTRFGFSLTTVDINHDSIDDLVVSAPTQGNGGPDDITNFYNKEYHGKVYVYLGRKGLGILKNASPDFVIKADNDSERFTNLGF
jgi:hypothetical protein